MRDSPDLLPRKALVFLTLPLPPGKQTDQLQKPPNRTSSTESGPKNVASCWDGSPEDIAVAVDRLHDHNPPGHTSHSKGVERVLFLFLHLSHSILPLKLFSLPLEIPKTPLHMHQPIEVVKTTVILFFV